jgi:hypothetical protein
MEKMVNPFFEEKSVPGKRRGRALKIAPLFKLGQKRCQKYELRTNSKRFISFASVEDRTGKDTKMTLIFARLFRQRCWRGVNSRVANSLQFASWISLLASSSPAHRFVPPSKISAWSELLRRLFLARCDFVRSCYTSLISPVPPR